MEIALFSILVFAVAMLFLSISVIFKGKQIQGHCGGGVEEEEGCIKDSLGNKIQSCSNCSCESI